MCSKFKIINIYLTLMSPAKHRGMLSERKKKKKKNECLAYSREQMSNK